MVIPSYLPITRINANDRNEAIKEYFNAGFQYAEILGFLFIINGVSLSLRQLKRILKALGLSRRKRPSEISNVVDAIEMELSGSGSCVGYRQIHQRLRDDYGLVVDRNTVRLVMGHLDPDGVLRRTRKRFIRRTYHCKGPNFLWHIDGYDKLKPFGFAIHGAIDGYSRRILWLEVAHTNKDPCVVGNYFVECVEQIGGAPVVRGDCGTENVYVAGIQRFLRRECQDDLAGFKSFMYGTSVANQRTEAWWSYLRRSSTTWWINMFKELRDQGLFDDSDVLHVVAVKWQVTRRCSRDSSITPQKEQAAESVLPIFFRKVFVTRYLFRILYWNSRVFVSKATLKGKL